MGKEKEFSHSVKILFYQLWAMLSFQGPQFPHLSSGEPGLLGIREELQAEAMQVGSPSTDWGKAPAWPLSF
jgi:hypothetical protein